MRLPIHTAGEEAHAHARHTGHRGLDLFLALCAIFISAISLYVAVEHGRIEARLVAANSWPFLQIDSSISSHTESWFRLVNGGVGPAKLDSFEVIYQGRPQPDLRTLLRTCCGLSDDPAPVTPQLPKGLSTAEVDHEVFRPGQSETVLGLDGADVDQAVYQRFVAVVRDLSFRGCYCSVFDECWASNFRDLHPTPVRQCVPARSFNETVMGRLAPARPGR